MRRCIRRLATGGEGLSRRSGSGLISSRVPFLALRGTGSFCFMQAAKPITKISTAGIISKPRSEQAARVAPALVEWLAARGVGVRCDPETAGYLTQGAGIARDGVAEGAQLLIVLGGDGTLLSAARALQ